MTKALSKWLLIARLSLADLWYDKKVSFCIIASVISVITPLLLLFSLKYGIVSQLREQLVNDPQNLEIKIVGNLQLNDEMFNWIKKQPETAFVIPLTRSLNTQADLIKDASHFVNNAEIIPTDKGDPITYGLVLLSKNQILLSALSAEKMQASVGSHIKMAITRQLDGKLEKGITVLEVMGIIPENRYNRAAAFVSLDLLIAMEDFYDGYQSDIFKTSTGQLNPLNHTSFARARIYANELDNVAPLAFKLREKHIETRTQSNAIENVKAIDRVLNFIFSVIAITAGIGCILSFSGSFLSNIERKRKDIAFMRLIGFQSKEIMFYLINQAITLSCLAFFISFVLFLLGNYAFNTILGENLVSQPIVSRLQFYHFIIAFMLILFISALVVAIGGRRAIKIQPAESLREA
ncbi:MULTISPECIES: ABC transporter permease [unclassified Gilliamella]|uniref:ABC transporter permease n=1 Tax=unclassified Gilliamella TaxID=2685620 RepID=UPI00130C639E|nr:MULTISPECIES: FtsX-like permease family protein [unclassified Gilliamella]MWP49203.1 FtsX-like permease family protein [Gilliamella sp. Lep-s35]MWP68082.1 FtsX-like permease family protein [Gilliamella sp. Lep-s5]MWP76302.1 FtsX-like permease family protein [Gilliamella sp. Lep-s21]